MTTGSCCGQISGILVLLCMCWPDERWAVVTLIILLPTGGLRRAAGRCACMQRVRQGGMGARAAGRPCASSLSFKGVMQADKCSRTN